MVSQFRNQAYALAVISALFGFFGFATYPISMELAVECSYPVGEGTSSGLVFVISQILGAIFMVLLQSLAVEIENSTLSACKTTAGGPLDWSTSVLVLAGICSVMSCFFVVAFHTTYRRIFIETANPINETDDDTRAHKNGKEAD